MECKITTWRNVSYRLMVSILQNLITKETAWLHQRMLTTMLPGKERMGYSSGITRLWKSLHPHPASHTCSLYFYILYTNCCGITIGRNKHSSYLSRRWRRRRRRRRYWDGYDLHAYRHWRWSNRGPVILILDSIARGLKSEPLSIKQAGILNCNNNRTVADAVFSPAWWQPLGNWQPICPNC